MNWLKNIITEMTSAGRAFISFIIPIVKSDAGTIIAQALPLALQIVQNVGTQGLTGNAARDAAVSQLKTQLTTQGIAAASNIGVSTLNFVVETALQHLNATQG